MKMTALVSATIATGLVGIAAVPAVAVAQERTVTTTTTRTTVRHNDIRGRRWHTRRVCRWQYRNHHRVRVCRTVRYHR